MEKRRVFILIIISVLILISGISFLFTNNKYEIKFDCNSYCKNDITYVKKGQKLNKPKDPKMKGKVFIEWQLNGKKYNFNKPVNKSIVLKAKWLPEIYVKIIFEQANINNISVLAGSCVKDYVKNPIKEGYKFLGWYVNDREFNLNKKITSNLKLTAKWQKIETNKLEIGDIVLIIGDYSNSINSLNANNSKAIGWKRKIIKIYDNSKFPYAVGNNQGITGYFDSKSLQKI